MLLPWLAGSLLPTALQPDPLASFETPQHANSSAVRAVWEAASYRLCMRGISRLRIKGLGLALRRMALIKAREDLT